MGRIKISLSVDCFSSSSFLQFFPVTLLRSSTQTEERQSLHNLFTKLSVNIPIGGKSAKHVGIMYTWGERGVLYLQGADDKLGQTLRTH